MYSLTYVEIYRDELAAQEAAHAWAASKRADWEVTICAPQQTSRNMVSPCNRDSVPMDAIVLAIVVDCEGPFARNGEDNRGRSRSVRAFGWCA